MLLQKEIARLYETQKIDSIQYANLDNTFKNLCDSMGKCERIKNTIFPIQYSLFTKLSIFIYMFLFPFGIIRDFGMNIIPITFLVFMFFGMLDAIAGYMQDPFENRRSDTPMTGLTRTIERNLLQMINEKEVPEKVEATNGVLM